MKGKTTWPGRRKSSLPTGLFFYLLVNVLLFFPSLAGQVNSGSNQVEVDTLEKALKIVNFLEEVADHYQKTGRFQGKSAEFSEEDLSAFFQEMFSAEVPAFKKITLKLFPRNKVEGWIVLNFKGMELPSFVKEEINLYFSAVAEIKERKIRLNFANIFLETQKIQPEAVEALIKIVAEARGLETKSLESWYDLPTGLSGLATRKGRIIVNY